METSIHNSRFMVEFVSYPQYILENVDEVFRIARRSIEMAVLADAAIWAIGIQYWIELAKLPNGSTVLGTTDGCSGKDFDCQLDIYGTGMTLGKYPLLAYAVRDFNAGLLDRENCPLLFYRAIETVARMYLSEFDKTIESKQWNAFNADISVSEYRHDDDLKTLLAINKKHRHGDRVFFDKSDHLRMMRVTKFILNRAIRHFYDEEVRVNATRLRFE